MDLCGNPGLGNCYCDPPTCEQHDDCCPDYKEFCDGDHAAKGRGGPVPEPETATVVKRDATTTSQPDGSGHWDSDAFRID